MEVQPDDRLFFTNYPAKSIEVLSPGGQTSTFAKLLVYPLSLISTPDGYLVAASGKSLPKHKAKFSKMVRNPIEGRKLVIEDNWFLEAADYWEKRAKNIQISYIGAGIHSVQEDQPYAIGKSNT